MTDNKPIKDVTHLKALLTQSDYVVIKIAEAATPEEAADLRNKYTEIINKRIAIRRLINELENES